MIPVLNLDYLILHFFNVDVASPAMDQFWLVLTHLERNAWFSFGILPLILSGLFYIYRWSVFKLVLVLAVAVACSDALAYRVIKNLVDRPRPFQNLEISSWVRQVGDAHGPSFPSNHAANCFAGAVILAWYFRRQGYLFYTIALLVGISRIALGVHYPSDVLAGMILGIVVGFLVRFFLLEKTKLFHLRNRVSKAISNSPGWRTRIRRLEDV